MYGAGQGLGSTAVASGVRRAPETQQARMGSPAGAESFDLVVLGVREHAAAAVPGLAAVPKD